MSINPEEIRTALLNAIPDSKVTLTDLRDDGEHYSIFVASKSFRNKTRVEQHKEVYKALKNIVTKNLDSFAIQTKIIEN